MLYNAQSPLGSRGCIHPTTWVILIVLLIEHSSAVCSSEERGRKKSQAVISDVFSVLQFYIASFLLQFLGASFLHLFGSIFKMFNKEFSAPRQYIQYPSPPLQRLRKPKLHFGTNLFQAFWTMENSKPLRDKIEFNSYFILMLCVCFLIQFSDLFQNSYLAATSVHCAIFYCGIVP